VPAHPLRSHFGPPRLQWRRILVIGHEPDNSQRMGTHAGPYDLRADRRTTFWILSQKAVGRASGFGEYLRAAAVECGSSPIVYSDASPVSYAVGENALPTRPPLTDAELVQHARDLLEVREALACRLVIISGRKAEFAAFYEAAGPGFRSAGATVVDVPFFGYADESTAETLLKPLLGIQVQALAMSAWWVGDRRRKGVPRLR
jgi:hypothetical protein